jgi:hypothetical protein
MKSGGFFHYHSRHYRSRANRPAARLQANFHRENFDAE